MGSKTAVEDNLEITISPGVVEITPVTTQKSFANLNISIKNIGADNMSLEAIGIGLPVGDTESTLVSSNSLNDIQPVALQDDKWLFGKTSVPGAFQAGPKAGTFNELAHGETQSFLLNHIPVNHKVGFAVIDAIVKTTLVSIPKKLTVIKEIAKGEVFLIAEPTEIFPGQASKLTWGGKLISDYYLTPTADPYRSVAGSENVMPRDNTTYTLDASGRDGTGSKFHLQTQVAVTVLSPRVLDFKIAGDNPVDRGSFLEMKWDTENALGVNLICTDKEITIPPNLPLKTDAGSPIRLGPVTKPLSFTFIAVRGAISSEPRYEFVTIKSPEITDFSIEPVALSYDKPIQFKLSWQIKNAFDFELVVLGDQPVTLPVPKNATSFIVTPVRAETVYKLTAFPFPTSLKQTKHKYYESFMEENLTVPATQQATASIFNVPVGTIMPYMGASENFAGLKSQGWLLCDGTEYEQNAYLSLYRVIKNSSGSSGSRFNVPDLRGMFLRGVSDQSDTDPDKNARTAQRAGGNTNNAVGSKQDDAFKSHTHNVDMYYKDGFRLTSAHDNWEPPHSVQTKVTAATGGSETRPKNVYVYYLIFAGIPAA